MLYALIIICIVICLITVFVCLESYRENRIISISNYEIESDKIDKETKAVMIADLHNSTYGKDNCELIDRINKLNPDVILVAGDCIIGKEDYPLDVAINLLNNLGDRFDVYVAKGNHELRCSMYTEQYKDMWPQLYNRTKDKVTWLIDEAIYLKDSNITINGLDLDREYYRRFTKLPMDDNYLLNKMPKLNSNSYNVLLAHNPDYFEEYSKWGADLTLSGHIHGGMIIIPKLGGVVSPMVRFFPKYYKGLYNYNDSSMILSGGLGIHTFRFRVNNKPDLVFINLKPKITE